MPTLYYSTGWSDVVWGGGGGFGVSLAAVYVVWWRFGVFQWTPSRLYHENWDNQHTLTRYNSGWTVIETGCHKFSVGQQNGG